METIGHVYKWYNILVNQNEIKQDVSVSVTSFTDFLLPPPAGAPEAQFISNKQMSFREWVVVSVSVLFCLIYAHVTYGCMQFNVKHINNTVLPIQIYDTKQNRNSS